MVYKNQRVHRKENNENPIFLGPLLLHKDATYQTYKVFLEHINTQIYLDIDNIEVRISENMEFGSDDEKALTKAIDHVFPSANRYLCTKHLKDNVTHYIKDKTGMDKLQREETMTKLFGNNGITAANSAIQFDSMSTQLELDTETQHPTFANYFKNHLKSKLRNHDCTCCL